MNKLREYQGVTYRDEVWWYEGVGYDSAIHLLHLADWGSDADHAALMDLKAQPYESEPLVSTYNLTAADHIRALEAMGAQRIGRILSIEHQGRGGHPLIGETALILPPEMTP